MVSEVSPTRLYDICSMFWYSDTELGQQVSSVIIPAIACLMQKWLLATDMMWTPLYMLLVGRMDNTLNATDLVQTDELMDSFGYE
jgi:hypothetical protein